MLIPGPITIPMVVLGCCGWPGLAHMTVPVGFIACVPTRPTWSGGEALLRKATAHTRIRDVHYCVYPELTLLLFGAASQSQGQSLTWDTKIRNWRKKIL